VSCDNHHHWSGFHWNCCHTEGYIDTLELKDTGRFYIVGPFSVTESTHYGQESTVTGTVLQIEVNGALFWMFFHRVDPSKVSHVRVIGYIALYRLTYHVGIEVSGFMLQL
jgi:hypothetical protein